MPALSNFSDLENTAMRNRLVKKTSVAQRLDNSLSVGETACPRSFAIITLVR